MKKLIWSIALVSLIAPRSFAWETPTMGWSSWNAFGHRIDESIIRSQADAMISTGLDKAGYKYINIDDGAWCGRDDSGHLVIHPTRFPDGLKGLIDYIHSKGLKAGTYSDAGYNTCASYWGGDNDGIATGLYGHDTEDINFMFKELGFDFIKVDFCGGHPNHNTDHLQLDERERYTAIGEAIKATGRTDVRYNVCRWDYPGTWVEDVATSWRMSQDIYLGWESVKDIIHQNLYLSAYARNGRYNDMDMLEIGRGLTPEEDRTHMAMWCMLSSPLLIGCDMRDISAETITLLSHPELIALNQDPLGLQAAVVKRIGGAYVLVKDVDMLNGLARAVAFYNPTDAMVDMCLDFFEVDLGGDVQVRDIINRTDMGVYQDRFTVSVPAHGTRVYRLEGGKRLERVIYEGETGRIEAYQELENNQVRHTGVYEELDGCSGGAKASWLGNREDNTLSWNNVYSFEGGAYDISIRFISGADRIINVDLNGDRVATLVANSGAWDTVGTVDFQATLQKGDNIITLSSPSDWMPDIDCMIVIKEGSLDYYRNQHAAALAAVNAIGLDALPEGLAGYYGRCIESLSNPELTRDAYLSATSDLNDLRVSIENSIAAYQNYLVLFEVAKDNADATEECKSLSDFNAVMSQCDSRLSAIETHKEINEIVDALRSAMKTFITSTDARLKPGCSWNVDILINNPSFDSNVSGWSGSPVWGYQCAEHWNKSFNTQQTVTGLKNGYYVLRARALYRRAANDGGTAYRMGTEKIDATLSANNVSVPVTSLYAHPLSQTPELHAVLSGTHVLKGYVNSMYGASTAFAHGLYDHELPVEIVDGKLVIGIACPTSIDDCWCCFDDFRLEYLGDEQSGIEEIVSDATAADGPVYNLQGIKVADKAVELPSLPAGYYIVGGRIYLKH